MNFSASTVLALTAFSLASAVAGSPECGPSLPTRAKRADLIVLGHWMKETAEDRDGVAYRRHQFSVSETLKGKSPKVITVTTECAKRVAGQDPGAALGSREACATLENVPGDPAVDFTEGSESLLILRKIPGGKKHYAVVERAPGDEAHCGSGEPPPATLEGWKRLIARRK